jgi:hypothetical protein
MSDHRSPPPDPAACLARARPSTQKGGTLIAEDVADLDAHRRRLCDPDGYRPPACPTCLHDVLHAHGFRGRVTRAEPQGPTVEIRIYRCTDCRATWRILPRPIARHLWRTWPTVQTSMDAEPPPSAPHVPERTVRRWRERLASSARQLVQLLATTGRALLEAVAQAVGLDATRAEVVAAYEVAIVPAPASVFADLAALVHRLEPGVRLM